MIRLDKYGRVLSSGFNGESLPSYADEVTHGLGEGKPAGEKVRSLMARIAAKRKEKAKKTAVAIAIEAQSKQAFKNLVSAKRLSEQAKKAQRIENAKAKVKIAASKQRSLGFDFSGLIGDPLAGFDDTATILASSGLLGEGLYDDVIEGEDFGNTMLGAAPKKSVAAAPAKSAAALKKEVKPAQAKVSMASAKSADSLSKAIAEANKKEQSAIAQKVKALKEAGIKNPELAVQGAPYKTMSVKDVEKVADSISKSKSKHEEARKRFDASALTKLPALEPGKKRSKKNQALYHIFFIQAALAESKKYHDTDKKYKLVRGIIDSEVKKLDKVVDSMDGKERKDGDNNRSYIKNEISKSHTKAIERTIKWRKKNGKCGFLGADCIFPPDPLLIVGAAVLIVGTIATGGALLAGIGSVASAATGAVGAVGGVVGGIAGSAASAIGLGAASGVVSTVAASAATAAIGKGVSSLIPKEVKGLVGAAKIASGGVEAGQSLASGELKMPSSEQLTAAATDTAKSEAEKKSKELAAQAAKVPEKKKKEVIAKAKSNAKKAAVKDVAIKAKIPEASIKAVVEGRTPPTPVPPTIAEMAKKQVAETEQATLAIVQEKTGIQTGAENPVWTAKDVAQEVSPQELKAGGFAPVQTQAKLANAAEGLGVEIADKPDLSLSKEHRNQMATEVAKSEHVALTDKYAALVKAGKDLELAKKSNLPAASIKNLELQYAESVAQYDKAKLVAGVKVAAAAQGRLESNAHPMARFF